MKSCFIITPIGDVGTSVRREVDGLIKNVYTPVLKEYGFEPIASHDITNTGSINRQVIEHLITDELVIANLTNLNPNVMYELGIRHCVRKPVISIAREGTILPFDLGDQRTIMYKNDIAAVNELTSVLSKMIASAIEDENPENPVYQVVDNNLIKYPESATDMDVLLARKLEHLEDSIEKINNNFKSQLNVNELHNTFPILNRRVSFSINKNDVTFFRNVANKLGIALKDIVTVNDETLKYTVDFDNSTQYNDFIQEFVMNGNQTTVEVSP